MGLVRGEDKSVVWNKMCNVLLSLFQGGTCACVTRD